MTMISHILAANSLLTAFAAVGILMWVSGAISKYLTFGRIHGSAIAIMLGLVLAFFGGIATGGEKGVADLPALTGIGLMGGAMLRDFAIVATAFEVDVVHGHAAALESEPGENGLGRDDRLQQSGHAVSRLGAQEKPHGRRAIRECADNGLQADLRQLVDGEGKHVGWQSVAVTGERIDQRRAVLAVMPDVLREQIESFVAEHHVEREFFKRKRRQADPEALARRQHEGGHE